MPLRSHLPQTPSSGSAGIGRRTFFAGTAGLVLSGSMTAKASADLRVSLADFGAKGDGRHDDSQAWSDFLKTAMSTGEGFIPAGHYRLDNIRSFTPTGAGLRLVGAGAGDVLLESTMAGKSALFSLSAASLHVSGLATHNFTLIEAHETISGPIAELSVSDWQWHNDAPEGLRALSIFSPYGKVPYPIDTVRLTSIVGTGGVCGLWLRTAIRQCEISDVVIRKLAVPDTPRWHYKSRPDTMNAIGTACGLLIGDDTREAQAHFKRCDIRNLVIDGVHDNRPLRKSGEDPANCDGLRLLARNVTFDNIQIRNISNRARRDCTGVYAKVTDLIGDRLTIENAGHHEASLTFKGAAGAASGRGAYGGHVRINQVTISNTEGFVGRPAVYLGCADVAIAQLDVTGCGGDVEDPSAPGKRIPGASSVVRMSAPLRDRQGLGRLRIGTLALRDCVLGGLSERWAVSLGGYNDISIADILCTGLSNNGRFTGQGADDGPNICVLGFGEEAVPCDVIKIGRITASDCHAPGRSATILHCLGRTPLGEVTLGPIRADQSFTAILKLTGEIPIETLTWAVCPGQDTTDLQTLPVVRNVSVSDSRFCLKE